MSVSSLVQRADVKGYQYPETAARKKASAVSERASWNGDQLEILSRVVYEELGGDPFFLHTVDEFHSFNNISQAFRTM
jgi:hypothetical protein